MKPALPAGDALGGWVDSLAEAILKRQKAPPSPCPDPAKPTKKPPVASSSDDVPAPRPSSARAFFLVGRADFGQGESAARHVDPGQGKRGRVRRKNSGGSGLGRPFLAEGPKGSTRPQLRRTELCLWTRKSLLLPPPPLSTPNPSPGALLQWSWAGSESPSRTPTGPGCRRRKQPPTSVSRSTGSTWR